MPEWDDAVDANYDFEHDELSKIDRTERDLDYVWDIFEKETTPIDGVLISREQVEETNRKAERLSEYGVYDDPILSIPKWLPTISDCGAWGYKSLPFPPYGKEDMLEFYRTLDVSVGVTIDHLVLGSGKEKGRLYLNERAFDDGFSKGDIPSTLTESVDLMVDTWPDEWPDYVAEYNPSICTFSGDNIEPFTRETFEGDLDAVIDRLGRDPRAVYREDDKSFRYDLTLENAREMYDLYQQGDYPFRLMVAIQGWTAESYADAVGEVLDIGYDYVGIGGVAGSPVHEVRKIVKTVGKRVKQHEREHDARIDSHVFGFAKSEAFESIGRSGMSSFDSASMLRSAWTGGKNYRLESDQRYDAIRVRYPPNGSDLKSSVEMALRGRELLIALRAYDEGREISAALHEWERRAETTLTETTRYLREHRHDERYDQTRLRDTEAEFRADYEYGRELRAYFGEDLRDNLVRLLRDDDPDDPTKFEEYENKLSVVTDVFTDFPRTTEIIEQEVRKQQGMDPFEQAWFVLQDYAVWIGDEDLLEEYYRTLADKPWTECECPICEKIGVEVCIFRGNDRNRRRGFHNTRKFYDEFAEDLPKFLVVTRGSAGLSRYETIEEYLRSEHSQFWSQVHDLPVSEVGIIDASGVHEWWETTPDAVSFAPDRMAENLSEQLCRYQRLFIHSPETGLSGTVVDAIEAVGCDVSTFEQAETLRDQLLDALGTNYSIGRDFAPHEPELSADDLDILVIDQCSGSKHVPPNATEFEKEAVDNNSRESLLARENVRGITAADLYTGRQQKYITDAVRSLRRDGHDIDRYFISAGFGLVNEDEKLPPYEVTFSDMRVDEIRSRSARLDIRSDIETIISNHEYDVVIFALGKEYYTSIAIDDMVRNLRPNQIGVVFNRELVGDQYDNIVSIPARTDDAERHGTITIGLKGLYLKNLAKYLPGVDTVTPTVVRKLCQYIEEEPSQVALKNLE